MSALVDLEARQRVQLDALLSTALNAAGVEGKLERFLPSVPLGRTVVIGGGKAAAAMANELARLWPAPLSGAVVVPYGHQSPSYSGPIQILEAGHPVPDGNSVVAADRMMELVKDLSHDDLVIALMSGGASALLVGLPEGVSLEDKQGLNKALLKSGATISEINAVRKQISTVKGGRLAHAVGKARLLTLAVSDIPGDDIRKIGSGPTIANAAEAVAATPILERYGIDVPESINRHLRKGLDNPSPDDRSRRAGDSAFLIVKPGDILIAAARCAESVGYKPIILGDDLEGEARELGSAHAKLALETLRAGRRACILSGGETSVTVSGRGRGGRNSEYLLGFVLATAGQEGIGALAVDTDGLDGAGDNAGAVAFASTLTRAAGKKLDAAAYLRRNDSYSFFAALDDLVVTGPTCTNVNDFRAILIDPVIDR
ncbi:glycerate kinase [Sphingobium sp. R-7]|uniref:glycerate kinase type-2 family protein n=1 Tax=Sphingobium sp. R-7 TaxID=3375449 RepID=UPI00398BBAC2